MQRNDIIRWIREPELNNPVLFVIWERVPGKIGEMIFNELNEKINGEVFCEITPVIFYTLNGVEIENDIAVMPENRYYCGQRNDIVIFKGFEPQFNHYQFISAILEIACERLFIKEIYTLNSLVSSLTFSAPRRIWGVYNESGIKKKMKEYGLLDMTYEGTPATSSYLLYEAKKKNLPGMSLWCEIPFYLSLVDDYQSQKIVLQFLRKRFSIDFELNKFDQLAGIQEQRLLSLRMNDKKVDQYLGSIEMNIPLTQEERLYLTNKIYEELRF
ncbi:MAG: PAC2 family protein [candidate division WOR-3 bacterium]